jgi:hypothetical protein
MTEPTERDRETARGHLTVVPWDLRYSFEKRAEELAKAIATAREEGRREGIAQATRNFIVQCP